MAYDSAFADDVPLAAFVLLRIGIIFEDIRTFLGYRPVRRTADELTPLRSLGDPRKTFMLFAFIRVIRGLLFLEEP